MKSAEKTKNARNAISDRDDVQNFNQLLFDFSVIFSRVFFGFLWN